VKEGSHYNYRIQGGERGWGWEGKKRELRAEIRMTWKNCKKAKRWQTIKHTRPPGGRKGFTGQKKKVDDRCQKFVGAGGRIAVELQGGKGEKVVLQKGVQNLI